MIQKNNKQKAVYLFFTYITTGQRNLIKGHFCLLLDFGQLTSFMFILSYEAEFYKPTVLKVHPPNSRISAHATLPGRLKHIIISFCSRLLIQMNNAWKMVSSVGWGFEPTRPLCREFSAVTTRPRLLALGTLLYRLEMVHFYF